MNESAVSGGLFGTVSDVGILALIIAAIVVLTPILLGLLLPIFKPKLKKNTMTYLYAFVSGFFIILAIFTLFVEGSPEVTAYAEKMNLSEGATYGLSIGIIGVSVVLTLFGALGIKYLVAKRIRKKEKLLHKTTGEEHQISHGHNHDEEIFNLNDVNPKTKMYALILIVMHKIPAALAVGFLVSEYTKDPDALNLAFLITFLLHIVPEELIFYYRQIEIGVPKWKAIGVSTLFTLIFVPFLFIGAYGADAISNTLAIPFIYGIISSLLLFTALVEFIPEFLHEKMSSKKWYTTMTFLLVGMSFAVIVLLIHGNSHVHEEGAHEVASNLVSNLEISKFKTLNINNSLRI